MKFVFTLIFFIYSFFFVSYRLRAQKKLVKKDKHLENSENRFNSKNPQLEDPADIADVGDDADEKGKLVDEKEIRKLTKDLIIKENEIYSTIDAEIDRQIGLSKYIEDGDFDKSLDDYMEIVMSFCIISLFGLLFPLSFLLIFFQSALEYIIDKKKLMYTIRRPVPRGASDIGDWKQTIYTVSILSIFTNSVILAFNVTNDSNEESRFSLFMTVFILLFGIKFVINLITKGDVRRVRNFLNNRIMCLLIDKSLWLIEFLPRKMVLEGLLMLIIRLRIA